MATLEVNGNDLVVRLRPLEKLGAIHGDVRVPLKTVTAVRMTTEPWSELRGVRAPGTGLPGVIALCTLRGSGVKDFAAVYRHGPAVVVETDGGPFNRLVISCADAAGQVNRITAALPS